MRSIWRTIRIELDRTSVRDIALVCFADAIVGMSFGAIAVTSGLPIWLPVLLSLIVFAGASQFIFVGLIASGGNPLAAMAAGLLVNARHLPFGFTLGDVFGTRWLFRILGSHIMIDESVAFALAQRDLGRRRVVYWLCGGCLFLCWNVGVALGTLAGSLITDTAAFGLDAAFPAVLLALLLPSLRDTATAGAAAVGAAVALATTPFLPAGLPVLLGLCGVLTGLGRGRKEPSNTDSESVT